MCTILDKVRRKSVTGYKVALLRSDNIIVSPFTSMIYNTGQVPIVKKSIVILPELIHHNFYSNDLEKDAINTNTNISAKAVGKTSIVKLKEDTIDIINDFRKEPLPPNYTVVLLEMTLSGNIYNSNMKWDLWKGIIGCYSSDYIKDFKVIKTYEQNR